MAKPKSTTAAFGTAPVTIFILVVYLAIAIPLIWIHEVVPPAPEPHDRLHKGTNLTEAWLDLATITNGFRPYNSRRNDEVREFLLQRIEAILKENSALYVNYDGIVRRTQSEVNKEDVDVTIFNDLTSNVTFSSLGSIGSAGQGRLPGTSVYFEGTNIIVYIRGTEDPAGEWWSADEYNGRKHRGKGGVLVNAHYDSVSTGYGATDDGVGVVTVLQLIRFFTSPGHKPKKGVVALLNNGEEDFLNGARAYTQHPVSEFAYTFLNLEGAGAGGRATLFRSTDSEVTQAYARAPHPFGTVIGADGFKQGLIRSGTDYQVFEDTLGLRGLDVAFWYPRARYHTDQDDARHTSVDSIWHMLSAAVETTEYLTSDLSNTFDGPRGDVASGKIKNGKGSEGVWFDLFGMFLAVFDLRALFAWSLTLAIASPLVLILVGYLLSVKNKMYFFSSHPPPQGTGERISLHGWRGFFRFPVALIIASTLTIGSALLVRKINPLIVYSSYYAVWAMMLSLWFISFWFINRGADFVRPSVLHRGYALLWLFIIGWAILVVATVFEDRFGIASGYVFVIYESAIFLATLISFLELSALPSMDAYAKYCIHDNENREAIDSLPESDVLIAPDDTGAAEDEEATETTPLVGESPHGRPSTATTFANYARRSLGGGADMTQEEYDGKYKPYGGEQGWSGKMPTWTWFLQFLLIGPFVLTVVGQVALYLVAAISQTGPDGSSLMAPYSLLVIFTILLLLPLVPFSHRISYHIPTFLFFIFAGTLAYNLIAFPFSAENRYKAFFQQTVDLETGQNHVDIIGLEEFVRPIIAALPSAAGQEIICEERRLRAGVRFCSFSGLPPRVVVSQSAKPESNYSNWLSYNVTRTKGTNKAQFIVQGKDTRACVLRFDRAISKFHVHGAGTDDRFEQVPEVGSDQIRLWHRQWDMPWTVDVEWAASPGSREGDEGMDGKVVCLWSDDNTEGVIPALDELRRFAPSWSAITKAADGLVEGTKAFRV